MIRFSSRSRNSPNRFDHSSLSPGSERSISSYVDASQGAPAAETTKRQMARTLRKSTSSNEPMPHEYVPITVGKQEPMLEVEPDYSAGICPGKDKDGFYFAQDVVQRRQKADGSWVFRIRWLGWGPQSDSWVLFSQCNQFLQDKIRERYTLKSRSKAEPISGRKLEVVQEAFEEARLESVSRNEKCLRTGVPVDYFSDDEGEICPAEEASVLKHDKFGFNDDDYYPSEDSQMYESDDGMHSLAGQSLLYDEGFFSLVTPDAKDPMTIQEIPMETSFKQPIFRPPSSISRGKRISNGLLDAPKESNRTDSRAVVTTASRGKTVNRDGTLCQYPTSSKPYICRNSAKPKAKRQKRKSAVKSSSLEANAVLKAHVIENIILEASDVSGLLQGIRSKSLIERNFQDKTMDKLLGHLLEIKLLLLSCGVGLDQSLLPSENDKSSFGCRNQKVEPQNNTEQFSVVSESKAALNINYLNPSIVTFASSVMKSQATVENQACRSKSNEGEDRLEQVLPKSFRLAAVNDTSTFFEKENVIVFEDKCVRLDEEKSDKLGETPSDALKRALSAFDDDDTSTIEDIDEGGYHTQDDSSIGRIRFVSGRSCSSSSSSSSSSANCREGF